MHLAGSFIIGIVLMIIAFIKKKLIETKEKMVILA
jgi:hypothetical protein